MTTFPVRATYILMYTCTRTRRCFIGFIIFDNMEVYIQYHTIILGPLSSLYLHTVRVIYYHTYCTCIHITRFTIVRDVTRLVHVRHKVQHCTKVVVYVCTFS